MKGKTLTIQRDASPPFRKKVKMQQYCHCGSKTKFADMTKAPAPADWPAKEVWVCSVCNKISHAVQEAVAVVRGPKDVSTLSNARLLENGQAVLTWKRDGTDLQTIEYRTYPRKVPMATAEPLIYTCWNQLMTKVAIILREPNGPGDNAIETQEREQAAQQARGMAELLATLMAPFLSTGDEVVRAAVKKYKDPSYEVPGLGEHLWDPMKNPDGSWRQQVAEPKSKPAARPKPAASKPAKEATLSDADKDGIKQALESGMFDAKTLAQMYKVSESTIKALA